MAMASASCASGDNAPRLIAAVSKRRSRSLASATSSIGVGVSWNSPFGPFRFDLAKALKKVEGDETQIFQFNVGTQF